LVAPPGNGDRIHGMYIHYFKLSEPPFSLTPDPRYLFMSERHREGLAHLLYGVQQPGGFVQLTGEIGSGKTTLCRCLIRQLPPDTDIALILNPRLTAIELLGTVCDELRIPYPVHTDSIKVLIDALNQRLIESHAQRRRTVLLIDEAQNLHSDVLEQIRLLTNLETAQEKLLQIILIGQPELLSILKGRKLKQLAQRITARYHLEPLSRRETYAYIQHRLLVAGRQDPLFTRRAMSRVYRLSAGVPRVINIICDRAMLGAYALDKARIDAGIVLKASRETRGFIPHHRRFRLAWTVGIAILITLMVGGAIALNPKTRSIILRDDATVSSMRSSVGQSESIGSDSKRNMAGGVSLNQRTASSTLTSINAPSIGNVPVSGMQKNPPIESLLVDSTENDASVFSGLYSRWGATVNLKSSDLGCEAGNINGFECLFQMGNWPKIRRYDLPVILELLLPNGMRRRVALIELKDETVTLLIGKRPYEVPIWEIDRIWDGSFILIWKPPFPARQLTVGSRGEDVEWVRNALDRLEGKTSNPAEQIVFDEHLRQRIIAFQREKSLIPDGCVGTETLARLTLALEGSKAPSISPSAR
jgi:general secretion pathway protein A